MTALFAIVELTTSEVLGQCRDGDPPWLFCWVKSDDEVNADEVLFGKTWLARGVLWPLTAPAPIRQSPQLASELHR
jgi:hypothetical protein